MQWDVGPTGVDDPRHDGRGTLQLVRQYADAARGSRLARKPCFSPGRWTVR